MNKTVLFGHSFNRNTILSDLYLPRIPATGHCYTKYELQQNGPVSTKMFKKLIKMCIYYFILKL